MDARSVARYSKIQHENIHKQKLCLWVNHDTVYLVDAHQFVPFMYQEVCDNAISKKPGFVIIKGTVYV